MGLITPRYAMRHVMSVGLAILSAGFIGMIYMREHAIWIMVMTFMVSQTTRGTPQHQTLLFTFLTMMSVLFASLLKPLFLPEYLILFAMLPMMAISYLLFMFRPVSALVMLKWMMVPLIFLILVLFTRPQALSFHDLMIDVLVGGMLSMLFTQFVFPVHLYREFRQGLLPMLQALKDYMLTAATSFEVNQADLSVLVQKKIDIEWMLQSVMSKYPEWVYETGFNYGLRSGFRFFLVNAESAIELTFAFHALVVNSRDVIVQQELQPYIVRVLRHNADLVSSMIDCFSENKKQVIESDYVSDMVELEKASKRYIPGTLELLDIAPEYLALSGLVYDLKDLRKQLLQLVLALPH